MLQPRTSLTLLIATALVACTGRTDTRTSSASQGAPAVVSAPADPVAAGTHDYAIRGTITGIPADRLSVTLDHEEVPGLMAAMRKMTYPVANAETLNGLAVGDLVEGRLHARGPGHTILSLKKR